MKRLKLLSKRFSTTLEAQLGLKICVWAPRPFPESAANVYIFFLLLFALSCGTSERQCVYEGKNVSLIQMICLEKKT